MQELRELFQELLQHENRFKSPGQLLQQLLHPQPENEREPEHAPQEEHEPNPERVFPPEPQPQFELQLQHICISVLYLFR